MGNVVFIARAFTCVALALGASECPPGAYKDNGTGDCHHCSDICQYMKQRGTEKACRVYCPDYGKLYRSRIDKTLNLAVDPSSQMCPPGQYYDRVVSGCDLCSSICQFHQIQHTSDDCRKHCPGVYKDSTKAGNVSTNVNSVTDIVISVFGVIAGIGVSVVIVVVIRRKLKSPRTNSTTSAAPSEDRPFCPPVTMIPEQSTAVSLESSTGDTSLSLEDQPMGLPDLPYNDSDDTTGSYA